MKDGIYIFLNAGTKMSCSWPSNPIRKRSNIVDVRIDNGGVDVWNVSCRDGDDALMNGDEWRNLILGR